MSASQPVGVQINNVAFIRFLSQKSRQSAFDVEENRMEEKKTYSVVGQVTIGTDEYRDLIESRMEIEKSRDYHMREGWKKDEEINNLTKQVEALTAKMKKCEQFIKKNTINISEDGIAVFMSMFGED